MAAPSLPSANRIATCRVCSVSPGRLAMLVAGDGFTLSFTGCGCQSRGFTPAGNPRLTGPSIFGTRGIPSPSATRVASPRG